MAIATIQKLKKYILFFEIFPEKYFKNVFVLHSFAAITCPGLLSPRNGTRLGCSGNTTEFYDTVCQFGCNNGYLGSGSHIRRCQENESWSGEEFVCTSTSYLVVMLENVTLYFFLWNKHERGDNNHLGWK